MFQPKVQLNTQELHTLRVDLYVDPVLACRTLLRDWFTTPMSWVHRGIFALLLRRCDFLLHFGEEDWPQGQWVWDQEQLELIIKFFVYKEDPEDQDEEPKPLFGAQRLEDGTIVRLDMLASPKTMLMLPRGLGKTTLVNAANLLAILYKDVRFLVYVSETASHADMQLGNIKRELESNELIKHLYGDLQPDRSEGLKWTESFIETRSGVAVAARGRGGQVRGLLHNARRPDRIVLDDVEDLESVDTDPQRSKTKRWYFADVEPALPRMSGEGSVIALGTLLHPEALLMNFRRDPEWASVIFGAIAPNGEPIAPFYMTVAQYEQKKEAAIRNGALLEFYMEYGSQIYHDAQTRKFRPEDIRYQVMVRTEFVGVGQAMDPAIADEQKGNKSSNQKRKTPDFACIADVGMTEKGLIHVLEVWEKIGAHPRELIDQFFEMHYRWRPTAHGIEAIAYQAALVHLMKEEMFRQKNPNAYFEIVPIMHGRTRKETRVEGVLGPRYRAGYITHQRRFVQLEKQLLDWPLGKKDCPDAVAMAITLLDPYAAQAAFEEDAEGRDVVNPLLKDQYEPLDMLLGDWREAP